MSKEYCHYSLAQIRESGLLSAARCDELEQLIDKAIGYVYDSAGKRVESARLVTQNDGTRWLHPNVATPNDVSYLRQQALAGLLNVSELQMINEVGISGDRVCFKRATHLTKWDGGVFHGDDFYPSVGEMIEMLEPEDEWPEYVWTATEQQVIPVLDLQDTIGHIVEDRGWEDLEIDELEGTKELQAALDAFSAANSKVISYHENRSVALLINKDDWVKDGKFIPFPNAP